MKLGLYYTYCLEACLIHLTMHYSFNTALLQPHFQWSIINAFLIVLLGLFSLFGIRSNPVMNIINYFCTDLTNFPEELPRSFLWAAGPKAFLKLLVIGCHQHNIDCPGSQFTTEDPIGSPASSLRNTAGQNYKLQSTSNPAFFFSCLMLWNHFISLFFNASFCQMKLQHFPQHSGKDP